MTKACSGTAFELVGCIHGKEASFALNSKVFVDVKKTNSSRISLSGPKSSSKYVKEVAKKVRDFFSLDSGLNINCGESSLLGLPGEREALCVSTVYAILGEIASVNELKVDKYLRDQFFVVDDSVVKKEKIFELCLADGLSYSKLAASFYGGFTVSSGNRVLRGGEMEDMHGMLVKTKTKDRSTKNILGFEREFVWEEAYKGNLYSAANLSSLIQASKETIMLLKDFLSHGVTAVSTDGCFILPLSRSPKALVKLTRKLDAAGVRPVKTMNDGVRVLENPRKIYRVNEFLALPNSRGYSVFSP
jgi:shikimate kinase